MRGTRKRRSQRGVFGVPTFEVDGELFWGADSMEFLRAFLADPATLRNAEMLASTHCPWPRLGVQTDSKIHPLSAACRRTICALSGFPAPGTAHNGAYLVSRAAIGKNRAFATMPRSKLGVRPHQLVYGRAGRKGGRPR